MSIDFRLRHQSEDRVVGQWHNFIDFMGCTETIKEMNKRNPAFQGGYLRNQRKVLCLLNAAGTQHRTSCLAHRHHVGMIAKDR